VPTTSTDWRPMLLEAQSTRTLIRAGRTFEDGSTHGYVVSVGPEFVLLCSVNDSILYDGFEAFRIQDIINLDVPEPHSGFIERALATRKLMRPPDPDVSLSSIGALLASASRSFPLITIHRQEFDPDACQIGKVIALSEDSVTLREIDTDAEWEEIPATYLLNEITRVDFGGMYEDALSIVGQPAN
jgi:hypothetical protein